MGKIIDEPKLRKIEKSRYIDRIVHTWFVENFLLKYYASQFISTSFACIKNKGTHKAAFCVQDFMKKAKKKWGDYYIIKTDVAHYFNSIDKKILFNIVERKMKDKKLLWLFNQILYSQEKEKGIEIGNYTSQILANIYLNEVDQYIKHELKVKYYVRYLDDSIIIVQTKEEALRILKLVRNFLKDRLELELNKKTQIFKGKQGVNFCGYKINEYRMKIRDRGKRRLKNKVKKLKCDVKTGKINSKEAKMLIAGHWGYVKWANVHNLTQSLFFVE